MKDFILNLFAYILQAFGLGSDPVLNHAGDLGASPGNPAFDAQFDLRVRSFYFTVNSGAYTNIAAGSLNAGLQNRLPVFLFGHNDYAAGYKKLKGQFPLNSNWSFGIPFVYGKDSNEGGLALDATAEGFLETGDIVLPYTSALPGTGTTTVALIVIRCEQIAAASLLEMTSSDTFQIIAARMSLNDASANTGQFSNAISMLNLSLFGKFLSDSVNPSSNKSPQQFQDTIVDIPIRFNITKHKALAYYSLYDITDVTFSMFVSGFQKVE